MVTYLNSVTTLTQTNPRTWFAFRVATAHYALNGVPGGIVNVLPPTK